MDFFKKTWVKITGWILLILGVVVLFLGGITQEEINKGTALVIAIIIAIGGLITFITSKVASKK